MMCRIRASALLAGTILLVAPAATISAVTVSWVDVGDPGNDCDDQAQGCFGSVASAYQIAETPVTNEQYVEFLNAVAVSDPNGLYNPEMANSGSGFGGINRGGSDGSFAYAAAPGVEDAPVNHVSLYDAMRFANWMHNGQPTGPQTAATTEAGAYTITHGAVAANSIVRSAGATVVVPSEDEWYKAAYYDGGSASYLDHPAAGDAPPLCDEPTAGTNRANCANAIGSGTGSLTPVGSYPGSSSPYGTLDQGGNVWEWNDSILSSSARGVRGGAFNHEAGFLAASHRGANLPTAETNNLGFRVAHLPEPGRDAGLLLGFAVLALARRRRRLPLGWTAALGACALAASPHAAVADPSGGHRGGTTMWDYCVGKPDDAPVPADPRSLVNPDTNTNKAVHYNVRWRNCHFDPDAVAEVGPPESCGEMRARFAAGDVLLDPGSEGPGGLFSGNDAADGTGFTADQLNQIWLSWGGFLARPENFDALVAERYGSPFSDDPNPYPLPGEDPNATNGGSGRLPIMFTQMRDASGDWTGEITVTCHACHSGEVGGGGGPGPGVLWGGGSSLADLNLLLRDFLAMGWQASAAVVLNLNRTRGRNNASLVNVAFGVAGADASTAPGILTSGSTADMDTVSWWNMGHRPAKFVDGIFAMDTPRVDGVFYAPSLGATPQGQAWMRQHGPDLNVWVESQKSPPWPYAIDAELAEEGERLFHELNLWSPSRNNPVAEPEGNGSCSGCHGAYASRHVNDPLWLDSPELEGIAGYTVPLEIIGTDPVRVEANNESIQEAGRASFFGYPPTRDQPHDCGPQNHPDLNDGRAPGYMAPPLYGIWATAPYFHNGSVPNLWEVLEPADRVQIWKRWSKPPIVPTNPLNVLGNVVMGFDTDLARAFDPVKVGWKYDEVPCEVESATNPSVAPYVNCDPDPEDALDPLSEAILEELYSGVFLAWNVGYFPPLLPNQIEDRKIFNTRMFAQGNEGHEFTSVLTDAERTAIIEYLKML